MRDIHISFESTAHHSKYLHMDLGQGLKLTRDYLFRLLSIRARIWLAPVCYSHLNLFFPRDSLSRFRKLRVVRTERVQILPSPLGHILQRQST